MTKNAKNTAKHEAHAKYAEIWDYRDPSLGHKDKLWATLIFETLSTP